MGSAAQIRQYTPEEYYLLESQSEHRSEYFKGEIFAMAGASARHGIVAGNIFRHFGNQLQGTPCVVFGPDLKLHIKETGLRTYPDISVYCGKRELDPGDAARQTYTNPTLLVEVLSPSTENYDRGTKATHYRQIESLRVILLVSQDMVRVESHIRQPDESWTLRQHSGLEREIRLEAIGITLPLEAIYRGVDFTTAE